jgi:RHS repeat-associated protein
MKNLPDLNKEFSNSLNAGISDKLFYFHANHLGSGSLITDNQGLTYQTLAFAPYGESLVNIRNGNYDEPYKFTGYERDQESGLDYAHARYYNSDLGVFPTTDAMWYLSPDKTSYHYCENDPINRIDPDGNQSMFGWSQGLTQQQTEEAIQGWIKGSELAFRSTTPFEDIYGIFSGRDFDGNYYNRWEAGGWVALGIVPELKGLKFLRALKSFKVLNNFKASGKVFSKMDDFYKSVKNLAPGERVAKYKEVGEQVAKNNDWQKNSKLSKKNGRDIYTSTDGSTHYSLDTQHGEFEVLDSRGKHQGSIRFDGTKGNPADISGKHNIKID